MRLNTPMYRVLVVALASLFLVLTEASYYAAFCQSVGSPAPSAALPAGISLDLSSAAQSAQAPNAAPVQILRGGTSATVVPGQSLTPAELLAVAQVLQHGTQSLVLSGTGVATGGFATITAQQLSATIASLVLPSAVSLAGIGFTATSPLNVTGSATIGGAFHALQTKPGVMAFLNFGSLNVLPTGIITTKLPTTFSVPGAYASSGLTINTVREVVNQGMISTAGTLNINAGTTIANQTASAVQATMAAQNLNLFAGSGNIVNTGLMQAMQAINVSTAAPKFNISGGDWVSKTFNATAPTSVIDMNVNKLTGTVNMSAEEVHIGSATDNLIIGSVCATGDPTFFNSNGNITIGGALNYNESAAFLASGDILSQGTASVTTHGGSITLLAGVSWTTGPSGSNVSGPLVPTSQGDESSTFSGFSINLNRKIDLTGGTFTTLNSSSTTGDGGNVHLVAGSIKLPSGMTIKTAGAANHENGRVRLIASNSTIANGGISAAGVSINTAGPQNSTGSVILSTALPDFTNFVILPGGATDDSIFLDPIDGTEVTTPISIGSITTNGRGIQIGTNGSITTNGAISSGGLPPNTQSSQVALFGSSVTVGGNITASDDIVLESPNITINSGVTIKSIGHTVFLQNLTAATNTVLTNNGTVISTISGTLLGSAIGISIAPTGNLTIQGKGTLSVTGFNAEILAVVPSVPLTTKTLTFADGAVVTLLGPSGTATFRAPAIVIGNSPNTGTTLKSVTLPSLLLRTNHLTDNGTITSAVSNGSIDIDDQFMDDHLSGITLDGTPKPITNTSATGGSVTVADSYGIAVNVNSNYELNGGIGASGEAGIWQLDENHDDHEAVPTAGKIAIAAGKTLKLVGGHFTELDSPTTEINLGSTVWFGPTPGRVSQLIIETKDFRLNGTVRASVAGARLSIDNDDVEEFSDDADITGSISLTGTGTVMFDPGVKGNIFFGTGKEGNTDSLNFNSCNYTLTTSGRVIMQAIEGGSVNFNGTTIINANGLGDLSVFGKNVFVDNGAQITGGSLLFLNAESTGTINVGTNASLNSYHPTLGGIVDLSIGDFNTSTQTTPPANVEIFKYSGFNPTFGTNGIVANSGVNGGTTIVLNGSTASVNFNTNGKAASTITLNDGVTIHATKLSPLLSLDLTNPAAVSAITAGQASGALGGKLIVDQAGKAIGGTLTAGAGDLNFSITAINIPAGVGVTLNNFINQPLQVLTVAQLNGSLTVSGTMDKGINVLSNIGPAFAIQGGTLLGSGPLTITTPNSGMAINGVVNFTGKLQLGANGTIEITKNVTGTGGLFLQTAGNNAITTTGATTLSAGSNVLQLVARSVSGVNGTLGAGTGRVELVTNSATDNIIVGGTGAGFAIPADLLPRIKASVLFIGTANDTATGTLAVASNLNLKSSLILTASGITLNGTITTPSTGTVNLTAYNGTIGGSTITTGTLLMGATGTIGTITTTATTLGLTAGGNATVNSTGALKLLASGVSGLSSEDLSVTAGGAISIMGNISSQTGTVALTAGGSGSITQSSNSFVIAAPIVELKTKLTTGGGSIGTSAQNIRLNAGAMKADAFGSVFLNNSVSTLVSGSSNSAFNAFSSAILNVVSLSAPMVNLTTGSTGGILLSGNVQGLVGDATAVTYKAGSVGIDQGGTNPQTNTKTLTITAGAGGVGAIFNIKTDATTVSVNTTGDVFVQGLNALKLMTSTGNNFNLGTTSGGVTLGGTVKGTSSVTLVTGGGNLTQSIAGTAVFSPIINLGATSGNIGASTMKLGISHTTGGSTVSLLAQAESSAYINSVSHVSLGGDGVNFNFANLDFLLSSTGNISVATGAKVRGTNSLTLTTGTAGSISQSDSSSTVTMASPIIKLTAGTGGIGTLANNISMIPFGSPSIWKVTANSTGSVFLTNSSNTALTLTGTSTAGGLLGFNILNSQGAIVQTANTTTTAINAKSTVLDSLAGIGTQTTPIKISGGILTALATNDVYIASAGAVTVVGSNFSGNNAVVAGPGKFSLTAAGNIVIGALNITTKISAPDTLTLTSTGSITQFDPGNIITTLFSPNIILQAGAAGIGTGTNRLAIASAFNAVPSPVNLRVSSNGAVFLWGLAPTPAQGLSFFGDSKGTVFNLTTVAPISFASTATLTGTTSVSLSATASGNSIQQSGSAVTIKSPNITLKADTDNVGGNGSIGTSGQRIVVSNVGTSTAAVMFNGTAGTGATGNIFVSGGALNLASLSKAGGTLSLLTTGSTANIMQTVAGTMLDANTVTLQAGGTIGSSAMPITANATNVSANSTNSVYVKGVKAAGTTFGASSGGGTGGLNLIATGSLLTIGGNLSANGTILVQNTGTNGSISISNGVQMSTDVAKATAATNGQIKIILGAVPTTPVKGNTPTGLVELPKAAPGDYFYGSLSNNIIVTTPGTATVHADGRSIIFSESGTGTITLGAGVLIHADPPMNDPLVPIAFHPSASVPTLFTPTSPITMETKFGRIDIAAGSVVVIVSRSNSIAVYDLHDKHSDAVSITTNSSKISLGPGRHALLTDSKLPFDRLNPLLKVAYRNLKSTTASDGTSTHTSEFSIVSALNSVEALDQLKSTTTLNQLLKNAAIIQSRGANAGIYKVQQSNLVANP